MTESEVRDLITKTVRAAVAETLEQLGMKSDNLRLSEAYRLYGRSVIDGLIRNGRLHPFKCSPKKVVIPKIEIEMQLCKKTNSI